MVVVAAVDGVEVVPVAAKVVVEVVALVVAISGQGRRPRRGVDAGGAAVVVEQVAAAVVGEKAARQVGVVVT